MVLHGQRRTGKTSILYHLTHKLGEDYLPVFIDLQGFADTGMDSFFYLLALQIFFALEDREIEFDKPQREDFKESPGISFRDEFLRRVQKKIGDRRLLLLVDEFEVLQERVAEGKIDKSIFGFLRNLMQHSDKLGFIFCGVHQLEELASDYWSVFFNIALYKKVGFFNSDETRKLICEPVKGNLEYDDLAIEKIERLTCGHPYFTQLFCFQLVNFCNEKKKNYATIQDVNEVVEKVMDMGVINIQYIWLQSSMEEKEVLATLSSLLRNKVIATYEDIEDLLHKYDLSLNLAEVTNKLILRDIVEKDNNRYNFKMELLNSWVEKNKGIQDVLREEEVYAQ
ncbi:MAG: hypothetical protein QME81_16880 [bacterium]|nr:hypothetical protein [bacterium]